MKKYVLLSLVTIASARVAPAQLITIGALGGVPLVDRTVTHDNPLYHDESRPYLVGPSFELRLPANLAVEVDGIYQRIGNSLSYRLNAIATPSAPSAPSNPVATSLLLRTRGNLWEIPVLGKYYFRERNSTWRPFLGTGWAFRGASLHQDGSETILDSSGNVQPVTFRQSFWSDLQVGATFAAGLRYHVGHVNFLPQIRYTRWGGNQTVLQRNEAGVMSGLTF